MSELNKFPSVDTDYSKCTITDIRRGKGYRNIYIYANLRNEKGEIIISADLDYIYEQLEKRLPGKLEVEDNYDNELY
jgi:hypothetical protein